MVPLFTSVIRNVSPTFPRRIGPGTVGAWPAMLNVHICCLTPGATSSTDSRASRVMSCTVPGSGAGAFGSRAVNADPGDAEKSILASAAAPLDALDAPVEAPDAPAAGMFMFCMFMPGIDDPDAVDPAADAVAAPTVNVV